MNVQIFRFFYPIFRPHLKSYLLIFLESVVRGGYFFVNLFACKLLIDQLSLAQFGFHFYVAIFLYVGSIIFQEIICDVSRFAFLQSQSAVCTEMIAKIYSYVQGHSYLFFQNILVSELTNKINIMVDNYYLLLCMAQRQILEQLFAFFFGCLFLYFLDAKLFFLILIWSIVFFFVMFKLSLQFTVMSEKASKVTNRLTGLMGDVFSNMATVLFTGSREFEAEKIKNVIKNEYFVSWYQLDKYKFKMSIIGNIFFLSMLFFVFYYTLYFYFQKVFTPGDVLFILSAFYYIVGRVWTLVDQMGEFLKVYNKFLASCDIILLPQKNSEKKRITKDNFQIQNGEIVFSNVCFSYDNDKTVFDNFNLTIQAGEKIGLVGFSGAGKSTLIALLLKIFDIKVGSISIDGQNIDEIDSDILRQHIAFVPQDSSLFHRTIKENIFYGEEMDEHSQRKIETVCRMVNLHEYITSLPEGYDTVIGERGAKLSGGQKQRVLIARALLKKSKILILDEATASLDSYNEKLIQKELNQILFSHFKTAIIIAHRLSTIKECDRIIVLDKGIIAEEGSHNDLLKRDNGLYKDLWSLQGE